MKLFNTIFYHFYLFYKKSKVEDQPISTAIFSMSVTQSFYVVCFVSYYLSLNNLPRMKVTPMVVICSVIIAINFATIYRKAEKIIDSRPEVYSKTVSKVISILFFALGFLLFVTLNFIVN
ncbi:hypothetical protein BC643_3030 [Mangrovibacterium diazotrophicum]|uniref:Uncharacterized protein n=1 Tax=Mangrovibacterium diazotrophicum TaxID=1261403 RepID=A0A419WB04_9BACT|nr:hypothetical protein BC643_3030 [Mangrovibacterium diazotrophicum]